MPGEQQTAFRGRAKLYASRKVRWAIHKGEMDSFAEENNFRQNRELSTYLYERPCNFLKEDTPASRHPRRGKKIYRDLDTAFRVHNAFAVCWPKLFSTRGYRRTKKCNDKVAKRGLEDVTDFVSFCRTGTFRFYGKAKQGKSSDKCYTCTSIWIFHCQQSVELSSWSI